MSDQIFSELDAWLQGVLDRVDPSQIRRLSTRYAQELRRANVARITAQQNPDGSAYEPRKPQLRHRKKKLRQTMFAKLRTAAYLKAEGSPDGAVVRFAREVERIAQVHHYGLRDRVNRRRDLEVAYPQRELLGLPKDDVDFVESLVVEHLAARL